MKKVFAIVGMTNYILVVFLNAFTDLGHKIIIQNTIFKVYEGSEQIVLTAIVNALVLLPFILMFSPSGFLADRFAKSSIMKYSALFAIVITLLITYAYYHGMFLFAFVMTFLLALQSAIYAPAKYGYIKELVGDEFITAGNGAVQATTTVAILSGIIFYTILFEGMYTPELTSKDAILQTIAPLGWLLVGGSIIEYALASRLPNTLIEATQRGFHFKRYIKGAYLYKNMKIIRRKKDIFKSIIALSLFWSISQVVLAVFGEYAKDELGVSNTIFVQGVMALAGIGIVVGSILVTQFSKYYINTGLATLGAIGMTIIVFIVPFTHSMIFIAFLFTLFGISAAFLLVPMNAYIQHLSPNVHLGTVLAGSNFVQNIFMFSFLVLTTLFAYFGMNAELLFYVMGGVGIYLIMMLYKRFSVMSYWAFFEIIMRTLYTFKYEGLENVPKSGAVLLLGNHVSWIDWLILQLPLQRRINFMIDKDIYNWKMFHATLKKGEVIPLSAKAPKDSLKEAQKRLQDNRIVVVFPEGEISHGGELSNFRRGYELIEKSPQLEIIPFFIDGVFGSWFARYKKDTQKCIFCKREITLYFGEKVPNDIKADALKDIIQVMKEKYETQ